MNKKKTGYSILMVILCTLITSFAQLLLKLGVDKFEPSFVGIITNSFLILGLLLYVGGAIIFVLALKHGDLSIIYPFISLSFIWVALLSLIFLGESIVLLQWLGIVIIIAGVSFIGWGAKSA